MEGLRMEKMDVVSLKIYKFFAKFKVKPPEINSIQNRISPFILTTYHQNYIN